MIFYSLINQELSNNVEFIDYDDSRNMITYGDITVFFKGNFKVIKPFDLIELGFNKTDQPIYIYKHWFFNKKILYIDDTHKVELLQTSELKMYRNNILISHIKVL
mgnify:CR=1 FL=1